jgi:hypothetical protein
MITLETVRELALALPEVEEQDQGARNYVDHPF